ncbi:MAG: hypothetical protein D6720_12815 [Gammaproteobacteria bacterium]|nr:MAG: hypothetical protein D6720_12815 [Gammaproteobacteria bacterium]
MNAEEVLGAVAEVIESDPHSAAALTLYALVNTLEYPKAGYLFKLDKLRDLSPAHRQLAYRLMDMIAGDQIGSAVWQAAKERMDELVRKG